jgi:hypothetical protein
MTCVQRTQARPKLGSWGQIGNVGEKDYGEQAQVVSYMKALNKMLSNLLRGPPMAIGPPLPGLSDSKLS